MSDVAHNYKPDVNLAEAASKELDIFKSLMKIDDISNGSYYIPGLSMVQYGDQRLMMMHRIYNMLVRAYPEYQFSQSESLNPNELGMMIRWRKK